MNAEQLKALEDRLRLEVSIFGDCAVGTSCRMAADALAEYAALKAKLEGETADPRPEDAMAPREIEIFTLRAELAELKAKSGNDAERFAWLCADLSGHERERRNAILERLPVLSYSAACQAIDDARIELAIDAVSKAAIKAAFGAVVEGPQEGGKDDPAD